MLVLMTLFAISAFNASNVNFRVVTNEQTRQEAIVAADAAIQVFSSDKANFEAGSASTATTPIDIDGQGTKVYQATIAKTCLTYKVMNPPYAPAYGNCTGSSRVTGGGVPGGGSPTPLCSTINWDIGGVVNDGKSNTLVEVHQGVSNTVGTNDAYSQC
jgi:hypothetical protein